MKLVVFQVYGFIERVLETLKSTSIAWNFEDLFEMFHSILGHIIIAEMLRNDKHYLEIPKMDLFAKVYDFLGHNIVL